MAVWPCLSTCDMLLIFATYYYYVLCIMLPLIYYGLFIDVEVISPSGHAPVVGEFALCVYAGIIFR